VWQKRKNQLQSSRIGLHLWPSTGPTRSTAGDWPRLVPGGRNMKLISEIRHNPDVHSDLQRDSEKRMRILEKLLPTPRLLRDNRWFRPFRRCRKRLLPCIH